MIMRFTQELNRSCFRQLPEAPQNFRCILLELFQRDT